MPSTDFDLNLIKVLLDLAKTKNMSQTARRLGKTPSAISKSLQKLRDETNDLLFIRKSSGLSPTPFTVKLVKNLTKIQGDIDFAFASDTFKPKQFQGEIVIAVNPVLEDIVQPHLFKKLKAEAPNISVRFVNWQVNTYHEILAEEVHIGIGFMNEFCSKEMTQRVVGINEFSLYMRPDHPAENLADALTYPIAILRVNGWNSEYINFSQHLERKSIPHHVEFQSENLSAFLKCLRCSDFISPLPKFPSNRELKKMSLEDFDTNVEIVACYPTTHRNESFYQWLFKIIKQVYAEDSSR